MLHTLNLLCREVWEIQNRLFDKAPDNEPEIDFRVKTNKLFLLAQIKRLHNILDLMEKTVNEL